MSRQPFAGFVNARIKLIDLIAIYMPTAGHNEAIQAVGAAVAEFELAVREDEYEALQPPVPVQPVAPVLSETNSAVIETLNPVSEAAGLPTFIGAHSTDDMAGAAVDYASAWSRVQAAGDSPEITITRDPIAPTVAEAPVDHVSVQGVGDSGVMLRVSKGKGKNKGE